MDRDRASSKQNISLIRITALDVETQQKIRAIRNEEAVRRWMCTDHEIGVGEHLGWIGRLKKEKNQIVFAAMADAGTPVGVLSANHINWSQKTTEWGYYLTQSVRGAGLGSALLYEFVGFIFHSLPMDKINSEVIDGNEASVKMHKRLSFKEEGFRRSNIAKSGKRIGVHLFGLTREDWQADRAELLRNHSAVLERFSIDIQWSEPDVPDSPDSTDQIDPARAENIPS